jgi:predicted glycoside hydrolase/deacetylase ChbG (UPF0249 family)
MRNLIITCDDCGLSEGINLATLELYRKGLAISPSVMINFAAARHALDLFAAFPTLEIGIHLNLTDGFPVVNTPPRSQLTRGDGRFRDRSTLWYRALLPQPAFLEQAKIELTAQMERFIQFGRRPAHITTHTHFHMFPALCRVVEQLAGDFGIPWIRVHRLQSTVLPLNPFFYAEKPLPATGDGDLTLFQMDSESDAPFAYFPSARTRPDFLIPLKYWLSRPSEELSQRLRTLDGTIEIVVHPCTDQDDTFPPDIPYSPHERYREMLYLEQVMAQG